LFLSALPVATPPAAYPDLRLPPSSSWPGWALMRLKLLAAAVQHRPPRLGAGWGTTPPQGLFVPNFMAGAIVCHQPTIHPLAGISPRHMMLHGGYASTIFRQCMRLN
jgi:hypothetical protein